MKLMPPLSAIRITPSALGVADIDSMSGTGALPMERAKELTPGTGLNVAFWQVMTGA